MAKRNAYPTAEADRYRNQVEYSRFVGRKVQELACASFLALADLVQWGWCRFRVDGCEW